MSYTYAEQRHTVFTEAGQITFLKIRDRAKRLIEEAGCFTAEAVMRGADGGDTWTMLACIDRLVELNEIREVPMPEGTWGQHRIYRGPRSD